MDWDAQGDRYTSLGEASVNNFFMPTRPDAFLPAARKTSQEFFNLFAVEHGVTL